MPKTQKQVTQFIQGLITESGELTFPENASVDELNCDLSRKGNRRRRLGIEYEQGFSLSDETVLETSLIHTETWENVSGVTSLEYLVVQLNNKLFFYNKSVLPLSNQAIPTSLSDPTIYSIDLTQFEVLGLGGAGFSYISATSLEGALVVVSPSIEPFIIERDASTGVFTTTELNLKVRDFTFLGDTSTYFEQEASPTIERQYDTANTGWSGTLGSAALSTYTGGSGGDYPPLTHAWFAGKDSNGDFSLAEWNKVWSGTSQISNGHFILDLFNKDRATASGVVGLPTVEENSRFQTVETYAGRIWYSGLSSTDNSSKVFFSKQGGELNELGLCYQVTDPTSEDGTLLDTDGGELSISGAHNINKLAVLGSSLIVFAENGVWSISGVDDVFRATEFSVFKITDIGLTNSRSFVDAEGSFVWWSSSGIHSITFDSTLNRPVENNISITTIQSFWDDIGANERSRCLVEYDYVNKKIFWVFPTKGETIDNKYNRVLILDTVLQAFYPWEISDETSNTNYIVGMSFFRGLGSDLISFNVVDSSGNQIVDSLGNNVTVDRDNQLSMANSEILFMVRDGDTGSITFASFSSTSFLDWGVSNYTSFAESGYDFNGDITTKKSAPFVSVVSGVTETGWSGNETDGYTRVRPSSLMVSAFWDFKETPSSTPQQAYRLKLSPVIDPDNLDSFNYPFSVVTTRLKLRGRGQSVRLKFESEQGKDFNLLGWEMIGERSDKL